MILEKLLREPTFRDISLSSSHPSSSHIQIIISSQTPDNPYILPTHPPFVQYASDLARWNNLPYIDHFHLLLETYGELGEEKTDGLFPGGQWVHTSPEGACVSCYT